MSRVNKGGQLVEIDVWKSWQRRVGRDGREAGRRQEGVMVRFREIYLPMNGTTEVFGHILEVCVMCRGGAAGKFGQGGDSVANVWSRGHIRIQEFTKKGTVGETMLNLEAMMCRSTLGWARVTIIQNVNCVNRQGRGVR
jgi:hypothetical protein